MSQRNRVVECATNPQQPTSTGDGRSSSSGCWDGSSSFFGPRDDSYSFLDHNSSSGSSGRQPLLLWLLKMVAPPTLAFEDDPYVKVSLLCDGRRLKKRKTTTKKSTLNPVYNEAIIFDIPPENVEQVSVAIMVMDYDRVGHNEVIGVCRAGPEATGLGRDHWNEMLAYPRKPITHWHALVEHWKRSVTCPISCHQFYQSITHKGQYSSVQESNHQEKGVKTKPRPGQLEAARDWKMLADVGQRLIFPPEIATTNLRPDIVLWSGSARLVVHLVELTVLCENAVDETYERKKLWYAQLAAEAEQRGQDSFY
ncbi:UNVERIFIED_CONTAM: hypothetical protein FKN15_029184 [Acipenser sinensis]